jgi:hypothetical protein
MNEDLAKKRFFHMILVRIAGVVMFMLGALVVTGKLDWNIWIGYFLLANGLLDALFMPTIMAKIWKKQASR